VRPAIIVIAEVTLSAGNGNAGTTHQFISLTEDNFFKDLNPSALNLNAEVRSVRRFQYS